MLDLGSLLMESDTETHARLPAEAAALYQCLRLTSRDISAYLVDGAFSFAALERAGAAQTGPVRAHMAFLTLICPTCVRCKRASEHARHGAKGAYFHAAACWCLAVLSGHKISGYEH